MFLEMEFPRMKALATILDHMRYYDFVMNMTESGITITEIDSANVLQAEIALPGDTLMQYVCDTPMSVGFDAEELYKVFVGKTGKLMRAFGSSISLDKNGKLMCGSVGIRLAGWDTDLTKARYRRLDRTTQDTWDKVTVEIPTKTLFAVMQFYDLYGCSDIRFSYDPVWSSINLIDSEQRVDVELKQSNEDIKVDNVAQKVFPASSLFTLEHILPVVGALKNVSTTALVSIGNDYPMTIQVTDMFGTKYKILLAPRLEPDKM